MVETAPKVFVCHAGEDKDFATRLGESLRASGVDAFVDKPGGLFVEGCLWILAKTRGDMKVEELLLVPSDCTRGAKRRALGSR